MLTFALATLHTQDMVLGMPTSPPWKRLTEGLVVVFDTFRSGGVPTVSMRITQKTELLDDVPLQNLIDSAKSIIAQLQRQGIDVSNQATQLPIAGMASSPSLAIRYNLPEGNKIRRIQLKFTSAKDFDVAYDHVRELGLWFTPSKNVRPGTLAAQSAARPSTAMMPASTSTYAQMRDAAALRPSSASSASFLNPGSTASSRKPEAAATLSPYEPTQASSYVARPGSASSLLSTSSDLPPRRELPFERLDSPDVGGERGSSMGSRPSSGVMGPPAFPASAITGSKRPNSRAGSSHSIELPPLRQPTYVNNPTARTNGEQGRAAGFQDEQRPHSAIPQNDYAAMQRAIGSAPVLPPATPRPASSYNTPTTHPLSVVTNVGSSSSQTMSLDPGATSSPSPPASEETRPSSGGYGDLEHHTQKLTAYANQTQDARQDEVNNFIYRHVQDDNFLVLVDDVQKAWTRIGTALQ